VEVVEIEESGVVNVVRADSPDFKQLEILKSKTMWLDTKIVDSYADHLLRTANKNFFLVASQSMSAGVTLRLLAKCVVDDCEHGFKYIIMPVYYVDHFVLCIMVCVCGEISKTLFLGPFIISNKKLLDCISTYIETIATSIQKMNGKGKEQEFNSMPELVKLNVCTPSLFFSNHYFVNHFFSK